MDKLHRYRMQVSHQMRYQQLNSLKENIRNLNLYKLALNIQCQSCPLCLNDSWLSSNHQQYNNKLIISIHQQNYICKHHIEIFLDKIIHNISIFPQNYTQFIFHNEQDSKATFIRKLMILKQIFQKEELMNNQLLWLQIQKSFIKIDNFISKLTYYGFQYESQWRIQLQNLQQNIKLQKICLKIIMYIFYKYPFLFQNIFIRYSIDTLIDKNLNKNKNYLYNYLHDVHTICLLDQVKYQVMIINLEKGLLNHIQTLSYSLNMDKQRQSFRSVLLWIYDFLLKSSNITPQTIINLLTIIKNHKDTNILQLFSLSLLISQKYIKQYSQYNNQNYYQSSQKLEQYSLDQKYLNQSSNYMNIQ